MMGDAAPDGHSMGLEQIYSSELPYVYSFLYRLGCRNMELEDLAHDVFVTAMRRWDTYDPSRPVRPWLLGIAFRVVADARRRRTAQREVIQEPPEDLPHEGEGAEERLAQRERRELVEEALESLEPERRAVFVMYELEGIPAAQIAEAMGTPVPTTYSRLRIGREEFTAAVRRIQLRRGEP
jgi:RNA polymerase sigma-70 factor, ECF subfamily